jgi:hypothetical protein
VNGETAPKCGSARSAAVREADLSNRKFAVLPWIRETAVVTDGETMFVKVRFKDSDEVVVVSTSEFHRFCHRAIDWSFDVERQEQDLEGAQVESGGEEWRSYTQPQ